MNICSYFDMNMKFIEGILSILHFFIVKYEQINIQNQSIPSGFFFEKKE
jgi:hypothetical protein